MLDDKKQVDSEMLDQPPTVPANQARPESARVPESWPESTAASVAMPSLGAAFSCRAAAPEDRETVVGLIAEYLPELDAEARFRWLYETNPHGKALTWLAFDSAGRPAGMTSFFMRKVWLDGDVVLGALGGDGYVRPGMRRQGLGSAVHRASRKALDKLGVAVMFGTLSALNRAPSINRAPSMYRWWANT